MKKKLGYFFIISAGILIPILLWIMFDGRFKSELIEIFSFLITLSVFFSGFSLIIIDLEPKLRRRKIRVRLIVSIILIFLGLQMKLNHLHGAAIIFINGVLMFCFAYLPILILNRYEKWKNYTTNKLHTIIVSFVDLLSIFFISYGILGKAMHWPGAMYSLVFGVVLFIISFFAWSRIFKSSLQNSRESEMKLEEALNELKLKHELIEEKNKEISDSINYAARIQKSFLATTEMLDQELKNYFVFFQPKDVVSGDFYWASYLSNGNFALCCADSTGHGVPGAIMSILNISSLEKAIETQIEPDKILFETRKIIIDRLKKDGTKEGGKDGMDCSLLVIDKNKSSINFASAQNPIIIIRDGEIFEFKGDKIPVGKHDKDNEPFTKQIFDLKKNDLIYILTDGFPDQFGGDRGKKYMIKNLKNFFLQISKQSMDKQKISLSQELENWKGSNEQVDDICIIGIKT